MGSDRESAGSYHESPVNLPHKRNLFWIRFRYAACVVGIIACDWLDALEVRFLLVLPCVLLALDDRFCILSRHDAFLSKERSGELGLQVGRRARRSSAPRCWEEWGDPTRSGMS